MKAKRIVLLAILTAAATAVFIGAVTAQVPPRPPVPAGAGPSGGIGVCNIAQVFLEYKRAGDLTKQLEQQRAKLAAEDQTRQKAIEAAKVELRETLKPGSQAYTAKRDQIEQMIIQREVWAKTEQARLVRRHRELTEEMYLAMLRTIERIAIERGYQAVLYRDELSLASSSTEQLLAKIAQRKVLFHRKENDITGEVVRLLNQQYKP